jgi:predicted nucleotidyltransferase
MNSNVSDWKRGNSSVNIQPDFEEFLRLLEEHRVEYMIVGGYAVAFHGHVRFTKDIDIFFAPSSPNIERLRRALVEFGFREETLAQVAFERKENIFAIGVAPVRIDLLNDIDGIAFGEAQANAVRGRYGRVAVTFIGKEDLIRNKSSTTRAKDKADVEELT